MDTECEYVGKVYHILIALLVILACVFMLFACELVARIRKVSKSVPTTPEVHEEQATPRQGERQVRFSGEEVELGLLPPRHRGGVYLEGPEMMI